MQDIMSWLDGKKTYIVIVVTAVFNIGVAAGWWPVDGAVYQIINAILIALGIGALRAGVTKSGPQ